jgi:hypothetical protein
MKTKKIIIVFVSAITIALLGLIAFNYASASNAAKSKVSYYLATHTSANEYNELAEVYDHKTFMVYKTRVEISGSASYTLGNKWRKPFSAKVDVNLFTGKATIISLEYGGARIK